MKNKPFEQLLDIYTNNKKVSKEKIALKEAQDEKLNKLSREKSEKVYELERKFDQKIQKVQIEKNRIDAVHDKKVISKLELERKIKLSIIINYLLTDASCSYGHGQWKEEDVYMEIDGNLFTITVLVEENNNKINKFTLRFFVGFKFYYLFNYFQDELIGCYNTFQKDFKTREEAEAYTEKNRNKIMSPLWSKENFFFREVKGFEYDVLKDFDFRGVQRSVSGETLVATSKTEATFSIDYDRNPIKVEYVGAGEFLVHTHNKEFVKRFTSQIAWGTICRIPEKMIKITKAL